VVAVSRAQLLLVARAVVADPEPAYQDRHGEPLEDERRHDHAERDEEDQVAARERRPGVVSSSRARG
jgi:hypothetical protein